MSFLIEHQTIVLLTVLTVINMTAVLVVAKMKQTVQPRISRKSMLERIKAQQKTMRAWMENPELDARFKEAGYPLRLTGSSFQKWRLGLWILTLTYVSFSVYAQRDDLSVLFALRQIGLLASVYMFTSQRFFLKSILKQCRELYIAEKNRELFMVYSIIRDEFLAAKGQSRNLLGILEDVKEYTDKIRPALDKAIIHYVDGTRRAMEGMAKEIDTPEAEDLCAILAEIDEQHPESALVSMEARQRTFLTGQRENKRRRMQAYGLLGYAAVYLPFVIYMWNLINLAWLRVEHVQNFTNHYG